MKFARAKTFVLAGLASAFVAVALLVASPALHLVRAEERVDMLDLLDYATGTLINISRAGGTYPTVFFSEDFETGLGVFTVNNAFGIGSGLWHATTTAPQSVLGAHSLPGSAYYGVSATGDYDVGATRGLLISPTVDLTGVIDPIGLIFRYYLETESFGGNDVADVQVSIDGGPFATRLDNRTVNELIDPTTRWVTRAVDFGAYSNKTVRVRFGFRSDSANNGFAGYYIDDVSIQGSLVTVNVAPATARLGMLETQLLIATSDDTQDVSYTWTTSNAPVAVVDAITGRVTGVGAGTATITAKGNHSGASDTTAITVIGVRVTPEDPSVLVGGTLQLGATSTDAGDTGFSWTSGSTSILTVSVTGRVTGVAPGSTSVVARGNTSGKTDSVLVQVGNVIVSPGSSFIGAADTVVLTGSSTDAADTSFTFLVSDAAVASLSGAAATTVTATGVASGEAIVTASGIGSGLSGTASVIVGLRASSQLTTVGGVILVEVAPGSVETFTFTSLDPSIATVDPVTGVVIGVSAGTVTIRATGDGVPPPIYTIQLSIIAPAAGGGGGGGGGGCFIASAAYGTPMESEVEVLREFRDRCLLNNPLGLAFTDAYYRLSPPIADQVAVRPWLAGVVRVLLAPVIFLAGLLLVSNGAWLAPLLAAVAYATWCRRARQV